MLSANKILHAVLSQHVAKFLRPPHQLSHLHLIAASRDLRSAEDGHAFSFKEFIECYGQVKGKHMWNMAPHQACTEIRRARDGRAYSYWGGNQDYGDTKQIKY